MGEVKVTAAIMIINSSAHFTTESVIKMHWFLFIYFINYSAAVIMAAVRIQLSGEKFNISHKIDEVKWCTQVLPYLFLVNNIRIYEGCLLRRFRWRNSSDRRFLRGFMFVRDGLLSLLAIVSILLAQQRLRACRSLLYSADYQGGCNIVDVRGNEAEVKIRRLASGTLIWTPWVWRHHPRQPPLTSVSVACRGGTCGWK